MAAVRSIAEIAATTTAAASTVSAVAAIVATATATTTAAAAITATSATAKAATSGATLPSAHGRLRLAGQLHFDLLPADLLACGCDPFNAMSDHKEQQ